VPDGRGFVVVEIAHDDDVAGVERRQQLLRDIGAEAKPLV
jgi:hypothetical protein